ncbi:MAG: HaeIII family restriction endonuclease [Spirochaetaceae bacterium]|nr:HaeIII family restriction endonuclease [Spirochaetaceae bacterium]
MTRRRIGKTQGYGVFSICFCRVYTRMEVLVWALSLRIHNASGWVEPSLKFDIQLIGVPNNLSSQIKSW